MRVFIELRSLRIFPLSDKPDTNTRGDSIDQSGAISCSNCEACCCRLEVLLMGDDDTPLRLTAENEWGGSVMLRLDDGWCAALDRDSMRCTIYARRPAICREYQMGESECIDERLRFFGLRSA